MGTCRPQGSYTSSECCPFGYGQITSSANCQAALDALTPTGANWGGDLPTETRPSGCFLNAQNLAVHFNPTNVVGNGATMTGDDDVMCITQGNTSGNETLDAVRDQTQQI